MYMNTQRYTKTQVRKGRDDLASLLSATRNAAQAEVGTRMHAVSDEGKALMPHIRANNLDAFIITQKDGGYVADFLLKKVSPIHADVFGSPDYMPLPTYADAIAWMGMSAKRVG